MGALATIERWFEEVWNQSRRETITELFAEDGVATGVGPEPVCGPGGFLPIYEAWQGAFEGFEFTVLQGFENGDWATARVRGRMTHKGNGRRLEAEGLVLARVVEGSIVEAHNGFDFTGMLERVGIFPGDTVMSVLNGSRIFAAPERHEGHKRVVRELVEEVFNGKDFDRVSDFYCEDCEGFDPALPEPTVGPGAIRAVLEAYESGFPGYRYELLDLIAEGDKVAARFVITAEHSRPFKSIPATGKTLSLQGNAILEFEGGKIRRVWQHWDSMGLAASLGIIDRPDAALM